MTRAGSALNRRVASVHLDAACYGNQSDKSESVLNSFVICSAKFLGHHRTGKGAPQDKFRTEIEVNILELTFKSDIWERSTAEKLANKFIESWDDWLNDTKTPPSPHQRNVVFCFSPRQLTSV